MAPTSPAPLDNFPQLLARNVSLHGSKHAYREKEFGIWQSWTWSETAAEIEALALGLMELGVNPGDHIAIIADGKIAMADNFDAILHTTGRDNLEDAFVKAIGEAT